MKKIDCIFVIFMAVLVFSGCAGTNAKSSDLYQSGMWISPGEVAEDLQSGISEANEQCEAGNYRSAIRKYDELLAKFSSRDSKLEVGLLTNKAMCSLSDGDQARFFRTASKLEEISRNVRHLSRETQVVLELQKTMTGIVVADNDPRIEKRISGSIKTLFEGGNK